MNPMTVAQARTARLVREAATPVYTTVTKPRVREHLIACEVESDLGGRYWRTMKESEVPAFWNDLPEGYYASDEDHSAQCWCFKS